MWMMLKEETRGTIHHASSCLRLISRMTKEDNLSSHRGSINQANMPDPADQKEEEGMRTDAQGKRLLD
jgi:hypothetical protein